MYFLGVAVWATRWRAALSFIDCSTTFATRYLILCAAIFLNNITPMMRVGGDPFGRVYMLHKLQNASYSSGMASSIGEHVFTPLIIVSFLIAGLFWKFGRGSVQLGVVLVTAWILAVLGSIFLPRLFFRRRIAVRGIIGIISRVLGWLRRSQDIRGIWNGIDAFYSSSYATMDKGRKGFLIGGLTLLLWVMDVLRLCTIFLALGYEPEIAMLLMASSLPPAVGLIPFLPGGLVLVEGSFISIFVLFGVPLELAMAATLIERGISFALSTIVGAGVFSYLGVKMTARANVGR